MGPHKNLDPADSNLFYLILDLAWLTQRGLLGLGGGIHSTQCHPGLLLLACVFWSCKRVELKWLDLTEILTKSLKLDKQYLAKLNFQTKTWAWLRGQSVWQCVWRSPRRAEPCTETCCTAAAGRPGYSPSCTGPMETQRHHEWKTRQLCSVSILQHLHRWVLTLLQPHETYFTDFTVKVNES